MADDRGVIREISWRDLCPWLILFRSFGLATKPSVLLLATIGAILAPIGWTAAKWLFLAADGRPDNVIAAPFAGQGMPPIIPIPFAGDGADERDGGIQRSPSDVFLHLAAPFFELFSPRSMSIRRMAYLTFGILWSLGVWSLLGGAITRIGVMRFGREEGMGVKAAIEFALRRWRSYFLAPLFPIFGVLFLTVPCALLGLVMRTDAGFFLGSILWIFVLLAGLAMATLLFGLALGWPLMWPTVSAEDDGDEFSALQHSFSYTYQRPFQYAFYAVVVTLIGIAGSLVLSAFCQLIINSSAWAVSWGSGASRLLSGGAPEIGVSGWGLKCIEFWQQFVWTVFRGFQFAYFWVASSAIYLLLRRDTDRTEFDEVHVPNETPPMTLTPVSPHPGATDRGFSPTTNAAAAQKEPAADAE